MKSVFLLLIICFWGGHAFSQSFYATTGSSHAFKKITVNGTAVSSEDIAGCPVLASSIALHNNIMYYINDVGTLWQADLVGNTLSNCKTLRTNVQANNLTVDKSGLLYFVNGGGILFQYNPANNTLTNKGSVTYPPAGDMIFYKDELYLAAFNVGIVKVNINNPAASTVVIPSTLRILGLAAVSVSSTLNKVYGLIDNASSTATTPIEIDLGNYALLATLPNLPFFCWDAAGVVEDGGYITLAINEITSVADCPFTGKGTINVISYYANSNATYTLENKSTGVITSGTNGKFPNMDTGQYTATVTSGFETVTSDYLANQFKFVAPTVTITTKKPNCLNPGEITVTTSNDKGNFVIVYKGAAYGSSNIFKGLTAGNHSFDIQNSTGCTVDTYNVTLTQDACQINIDSASVTEECQTPNNGKVTIYAKPGTDVYTYNIGTNENKSGVFSNLEPGDYTVDITSQGGGSRQYPIKVPDYSLNKPVITIDKTDASCSVNASVSFSMSTVNTSNSVYSITFNSVNYPFNHLFTLPESGTYTFKVLKPNGCVLTIITVPIDKVDCQIVNFPNTFSPNGDGINDIFRPNQNAVTDKLQIKVFTRGGSLIFTSDNLHSGWDGQTNGKPAPAGVYYWMASYINNEKLSKSQNGYITLIR